MKILVENWTRHPDEYESVSKLIEAATRPNEYNCSGSLECIQDQLDNVSKAIGMLAQLLHSAAIISDDEVKSLAEGYNEITFVRDEQ